MLTLYSYFRSSAAYRVRIALNLKGLAFETIPVHLLKDGGEQHSEAYVSINPTQLVPTLRDAQFHLAQSIAIMEYLEETQPTPPLLPTEPAHRARVRAMAQVIACDIHPLNNLRVLQYLETVLKVSAEQKTAWYLHWVHEGLLALESMVVQSRQNGLTGPYCGGDTPGLADCCLIPQLYNARRFKAPLDAFPTLCRMEAACLALPAFAQAAPEVQPDFQ